MTVAAKRPSEPPEVKVAEPLDEKPRPSDSRVPYLVLPGTALLLHLLCIVNYGFFRDELYYLACAKRLDWGYVDHPPLSVLLLKLSTSLLGENLVGVRLPVVLASAATVFLAMTTARSMGAGKVGLWLSGLCVLLSGMYLVVFSFFTMNALDILFWAIGAYVLVRLVQRPSLRLWIGLGLVLGLGFENKASILLLALGLSVGVCCSSLRKEMAKPGPWLALATASLLALPNLVWQAQHGWPTSEFAANALREKMLPLAPWEFLAQQAVVMNLFAVPVLLAGVVAGFTLDKRKWISLSLVFLTVLGILLVNGRSRVNYLAPAYAFVIPLGAVAVEQWLAKRRTSPAWAIAPILALSPLYLTLGLPWLPPHAMVWLIGQSPIQPPAEEKGAKSPMQGWADMFGWPELASTVKATLRSLPDREGAAVVTKNYGEAAALEHYGVQRVLCGHNTYWMWGTQGWDGKVAVFVNEWPDDIKAMFSSFEKVGRVDAPNAVPEQNGSPVWVAKGLKVPIDTFWKAVRKYV